MDWLIGWMNGWMNEWMKNKNKGAGTWHVKVSLNVRLSSVIIKVKYGQILYVPLSKCRDNPQPAPFITEPTSVNGTVIMHCRLCFPIMVFCCCFLRGWGWEISSKVFDFEIFGGRGKGGEGGGGRRGEFLKRNGTCIAGNCGAFTTCSTLFVRELQRDERWDGR